MPESPPGQEQRAFWAILLAMAVLLVWSVIFPPPKAPPKNVAEQDTPPPREMSAFETVGEPASSTPATTPVVESPDESPAGAASTPSGIPFSTYVGGMPSRERVAVSGETVTWEIDGQGARLSQATLGRFEESDGRPVRLIPEGGVGALGSTLVQGGRHVALDDKMFRLVSNEESHGDRRVVWELDLEEITLRKTFTVPSSGHVIRVEQELVKDRVGIEAWGLAWGGGLRMTEEQGGGMHRGAYFQGCVLAEGEVQKKDPNQLKKAPEEFPGQTYFVAMKSKYFLGAIVPEGDNQGPARLWRVPGRGEEDTTVGGEILLDRRGGLAADRVGYDVYVGPLDYASLKELGLGIEGTVDLGMSWIRPLSKLILGFLIWLHGLIPNYGVVIIVFASVMNLLFFPLTFKSTKSMRDMAALKPRLDALKEKYKNEPQKMSEATMKLYKEAGVNPLAGCLPLLLQMPIFFALYAVLFQTIELRQEPFVFWIRDLSQPDVVFHLPFALPFIGTGISLLPIIMGVTSYFQSKATMVDPNQKAMMYMMPVMMTFIFFTMPSGLVLYWLMSNLFTIGQKFLMKPSAAAGAIAEAVPDPPAKTPVKKKKGRGKPAKAKA